MHLPSIATLIQETRRTFVKFPLAITAGIILAIAGVALTEIIDQYPRTVTDETIRLLRNIIMTLVFALPLFASIQLASDKNRLAVTPTILLKAAAIALAAAFYFLVLPDTKTDFYNWLGEQTVTAWILIGNAFLLLTFLPFLKNGSSSDFWKYNKNLVKDFVLTLFFAIVLFGGIALILFSLDSLFEIKIDDELYLDFWIAVASVFSPWVFLGFFSRSVENLARQTKLSKAIKILGQFILTPLLSVYTVILYAYTGKILFTQQWPEGIVGGLVIGYAVAAMVTHILLYPFEKENLWISKVRKIFYILLLPLTAMLFASIYLRIAEYGITESRYYVILLGIWLIGIALYFIFSKRQKIKYIPLTVFVLLILSLFGPWSAFNISENDQFQRLQKMLTEEKILENSQITKQSKVSGNTKNEIQSILGYLVRNHGIEQFRPWIASKLPQDFDTVDIWHQQDMVYKIFGVEGYYDPYYGDIKSYYFSSKAKNYLDIGGYDYMLNIGYPKYEYIDENIYKIGENQTIKVNFNLPEKTVTLLKNDFDLATLNLTTMIENLIKKYPDFESQHGSTADMSITLENDKVKLMLLINSLNIEEKDEKFEIREIFGSMLVKVK